MQIHIPINPAQTADHKLKDVKVGEIILDGVKDQVIAHIIGKDTQNKMWAALTGLYQSINENKKMVM